MQQIDIRQPRAAEWRDYKKIRLEALKNNPTAYSTTYAEAVQYPDLTWQEKLEQGERRDTCFHQGSMKKSSVMTEYTQI